MARPRLKVVVREPSSEAILSNREVPFPPESGALLLRSWPLEAETPRFRLEGGRLHYLTQRYPRYGVALGGTFEAYLQNHFSAKSRSTLRRKVRAALDAEQGGLRFQCCHRPEEVDDYLRAAAMVSERTYQERLLDAGLPRDEAFRQTTRALAEAGRWWGFLLWHGQRPVSYLYTPWQEGAWRYAWLGYDPEYARWSCGTVLQWLALEELFRGNVADWFDFTEGEGDHKRLFATNRRECGTVWILPVGMRSMTLVGLHRLLEGLSSGLKRLAAWGGVAARLRRWVRR
ncbi:MAG: GNAT family N-acetyltransferase [Magnetococcales bacterium]|nr:GNAT family N-acetyltransferase [Magnetococcales bacterium]